MTRKINWQDPDWGGHVTYAANGSWVASALHEDDGGAS